MSKVDLDLLQYLDENLEAELARREMFEFLCYTRPSFKWNWHHVLLCEYLDRFLRGEIKRLMVFMPPQHAKSEIVSRVFPPFALGNFSSLKIILASYSASLASGFNRDAQRIMETKQYGDIFPDTIIPASEVENSNRGKYLRNSEIVEVIGRGGFYKTVGVGGSLTGTPADIAIIDDPVKDAQEAMSPTIQERNWNWYTDVLSTRLHNDSRVLITQTRWDVNDLSGKILKQMEEGGEQWEVLLLPAIKGATGHPQDPRKEGDALWPEKHSKEKLLGVRQKSIRTYEALYQQNPKPVQAGGEFWSGFSTLKHVRPVRPEPQEPIHISLDNNVTPYVTVSVWQCVNKEIRQIHEIPAKSPNNNAVKAAIMLSRYLEALRFTNLVYIYGDPSASARSTIDPDNRSFYDKFIEVLRQSGFKVITRVKKSYPEIALSANFINEIYEHCLGGFSIVIDSSCTVSIEDYYSVKHDAEGKMMKTKRKDPTTGVSFEPYGHFSDAKRYFLMGLLAAEFETYRNREQKYIIITK